ncbi:MAG: FAD-binding protein [Oscillospiraceae bacterium]|jgi:L-aspartate oxidase|nr:FAD-binding protein [Oscillospiraceae bacterium]
MNIPEKKTYGVIILGSGLAGLYAALCLSKGDRPPSVLMLSKQAPDVSGSALAQGGVAAVLELEDNAHGTADDSFALHMEDTLAAGNYINDVEAVETLVREGPEDVRRVMALGVEFDRTPGGDLAKTLEGGHSRRRIVHHADQTGKEMVDKLLPHVRALPNVTLLEATAYAAEMVNHIFTVDALIGETPARFACRRLLLATGGIGQVYRHTTNPAVCTGDGIRLAYELGAEIRNLGFVQFHPTAFNSPGEQEQFLISEAVRGEGAFLINCRGERFMHRYDPRLELAPRDVVSRAILLEQKRTGSSRFYLDIRRRERGFIENRFPGIFAACKARGVDMAADPVPVYPCQHYLMGGVHVDLHSRTDIPGLYAAGECAHTGLHGGNRLASNSLPEALVFGRRAAEDILMNNVQCTMNNELYQNIVGSSNNCSLSIVHCSLDLRRQIQSAMQEAYFVFPDREKLPGAARGMRVLYEELKGAAVTRETAELRSLACVAMLILEELMGN